MTDSDSLRGDPNYDPTRRTHPEIRELDTLRALLRPRMTATGDPTSTDALRGMLVEIERLTEQVAMEGKLARAAAEGHDHARATLVEIAKVFGRVDDHDLLPAMVRKINDAWHVSLVRADRQRLQLDLENLTAAIGDAAKAVGILCEGRSALEILHDLLDRMRRAALPVAGTPLPLLPASLTTVRESPCPELEEACHVRPGRPHFMTGDLQLEVWLIEPVALPGYVISGRDTSWMWKTERVGIKYALAGYDSATAAIAGAREHLAGRLLQDRVDELTDQIEEMGVALDETALNAKARRAALVSLGWDGEGDPEARAKNWWSATPFSGVAERLREIMSTCFGGSRSGDLFFQVADMEKWIPKFTSEWTANHGRWLKLCQAFGFDPEQDPPVSIPAILAGDRWTNTRRMLADACANLRTPSLEVILGELIQTLSKARASVQATRRDSTCTACARRVHEGGTAVQGCSDCYWLEFGDPPPQALEGATATAQARPARPSSARCPVCHRMAPVKHGGFQEHLSGDRVCAGTSTLSNDAHAALTELGWDGGAHPLDWAKTTAAHYKALREALGVPAGKPIIPYARHAAKGMQALATLGWQDGNPVEWATARAAAEADLRGAFAEAELVGTDHAAMVRQLRGNLQGTSSLLDLARGDVDSAIAQNRIYREALEVLGCRTNIDHRGIVPWAKVRLAECESNAHELGLLRTMNANLNASTSALEAVQGKLRNETQALAENLRGQASALDYWARNLSFPTAT